MPDNVEVVEEVKEIEKHPYDVNVVRQVVEEAVAVEGSVSMALRELWQEMENPPGQEPDEDETDEETRNSTI